jgi:hypothetical protein
VADENLLDLGCQRYSAGVDTFGFADSSAMTRPLAVSAGTITVRVSKAAIFIAGRIAWGRRGASLLPAGAVAGIVLAYGKLSA